MGGDEPVGTGPGAKALAPGFCLLFVRAEDANCGHVGCCDSSPNEHTSSHAQVDDHPIIQPYEPGEDWWCC